MPNRPEILTGSTRRIKVGCGNIYVTCNKDESGEVKEVFVRLGKAGGCASSQTESLGRLITLALRCGSSVQAVVDQLSGIGCHQPMPTGSIDKVLSCSDAVAKVLTRHIGKEIKGPDEK